MPKPPKRRRHREPTTVPCGWCGEDVRMSALRCPSCHGRVRRGRRQAAGVWGIPWYAWALIGLAGLLVLGGVYYEKVVMPRENFKKVWGFYPDER